MAAASTDFFTEVGNPGTATTLAAPGHTIAGTTFNVVSTSNWPTVTGAIFAVDNFTLQTVNGVPNTAVRTAGTYTEWEGTVASSTQVTNATLRYGTDQNYSAGSLTRVYIPVASSRENRLVQGIQVAHNQDGTLKANAITAASQITDGIIGDAEMATAVKPVTLWNENAFDHVVSGCVWTADAAGSTRNASMTSGVVMLSGKRLTVAAVTARSFTASKDVHVDFSDNGDGTVLPVYTDGTTNAASSALAAGSLRNAIVVVGATNIATAASINQGQEDRVLPIASSIAYSVTDSLGNLICPRDPLRRTLGYRQIITSFPTASATSVQITGLSCPVIVPTGRKINIKVFSPTTTNSVDGVPAMSIYDGTVPSGTLINESHLTLVTAGRDAFHIVEQPTTPTATSKTYNAGLRSTSGTATVVGLSTGPAYIRIELV